MKELILLLESHKDSGPALRLFISCLSTPRPVANDQEKEMTVLLVAELARVFGTALLDPLDSPPCIYKSALRLVEVVHQYFKTESLGVQKSCSRSLLRIDYDCLRGSERAKRVMVMASPLYDKLAKSSPRE